MNRIHEHTPVRTCVGCRATAPQSDLLRVVVVDGRAVADPSRRRPGRGAYVHRVAGCLTAAGRGGLARALRTGVQRSDLDAITAIARPDTGTGVGPSHEPENAVESEPRPRGAAADDGGIGRE